MYTNRQILCFCFTRKNTNIRLLNPISSPFSSSCFLLPRVFHPFFHERAVHCSSQQNYSHPFYRSPRSVIAWNERLPTDRADRTWLANMEQMLSSIFVLSRLDVSICSYSMMVIAPLIDDNGIERSLWEKPFCFWDNWWWDPALVI